MTPTSTESLRYETRPVRLTWGLAVGPWTAGLFMLALGSASCNSSMDVTVRSGGAVEKVATPPPPSTPVGPTNPTPKPTETNGGEQYPLDFQILPKTYYQTRDTVRLRLTNDLLANAPTLTVLNVTGLAAGSEDSGRVVLENLPIPDAPGKSEVVEIAANTKVTISRDSNGISIVLPPSAVKSRTFFNRGQNRFKVVLNDPTESRSLYITVTFKDFELMGPSLSVFSGDSPAQKAATVDGTTFQGWVNTVTPPLVTVKTDTSGTRVLTQGLFNILN